MTEAYRAKDIKPFRLCLEEVKKRWGNCASREDRFIFTEELWVNEAIKAVYVEQTKMLKERIRRGEEVTNINTDLLPQTAIDAGNTKFGKSKCAQIWDRVQMERADGIGSNMEEIDHFWDICSH